MNNFIETLNANTTFAKDEFSGLPDDQFNFKPSSDKWSIAQCILHLVKTNKGYFPIYDKLLDGSHAPNFFEKAGIFSGFWEKLFVNGVDPKNVKKMKAPSSIQPGQSHIDKSILAKLEEQNKKLSDYYRQLEPKGLDKIIVSSPFAKFIVYNAACTFDIVALHEQRHLQQAKQVKDLLK